MKLVSYWLDTAPQGPDYAELPLPDQVDVAVVGGGLTGLSAAIHLARKGASVALFEKERLGWGASGRNGGMCTTGLSISFLSAIDRYGFDRAATMYRAFDDAIDLVEKLVVAEHIDCDFARSGKLSLAYKPAHYERYAALQAALTHLGHETLLVPRARIREEIGSDYYHGGLVDPTSAGLHVGKFVRGLATVADRLGVLLRERTQVLGLHALGAGAQEVRTNRGTVRASHVVVATDGYTDGSVPRYRRRIVPVGSFIIVTERLEEALVDELMPTRRMASDSKHLLYYFRITPDNRMLWGGRARFAMSNPDSDLKSARILRQGMSAVFPQLREARIDYTWGGHVGMTLDRMPHAGEHDGVFYSLGYNGHGVQMSTFMGKQIAEMLDGRPEANPWRELPFRAVPLHFGPPWFLPLVGAYYRLKDKIS